ncbi:MAG: hypothetical protein ACTHOU_09595 [Aureliella sp.]|jgi:hypothetical protein
MSVASQAKSDIQLETDDRFQDNEWRIQRIGWTIWIGLLVAAMLGLLGPGLFSQTRSLSSDRSLAVTYDRFVHFHHPTTLVLSFEQALPAQEQLELTIDHALLDQIDIQRIDPEPEQSTLSSEGVTYRFRKDAALRSGKLILHIDYDRPGRIVGHIGLSGHAPATVTQFVFP